MKKQTVIISIIGAILLLTSINSYAGTVGAQNIGGPFEVGDDFEFNVVGVGFEPDRIVSFGINIAWDPAIVELLLVNVLSSVWTVDQSDTFTGNLTIDNTAGLASPVGGVTVPINPGVGLLATFNFEAIGPGISPIIFSAANDPTFQWQDANGNTPPLEFVDGSVTVVPLPAGVWLLGSGLVGVIGFRRRSNT